MYALKGSDHAQLTKPRHVNRINMLRMLNTPAQGFAIYPALGKGALVEI